MDARKNKLQTLSAEPPLILHKCPDYDLLRANIQNTNKPFENRHTAPYLKIWEKLSVADNGLIMLSSEQIVIPRDLRNCMLKSYMLHTQASQKQSS